MTSEEKANYIKNMVDEANSMIANLNRQLIELANVGIQSNIILLDRRTVGRAHAPYIQAEFLQRIG
jgi:hypothetical protein